MEIGYHRFDPDFGKNKHNEFNFYKREGNTLRHLYWARILHFYESGMIAVEINDGIFAKLNPDEYVLTSKPFKIGFQEFNGEDVEVLN